MNTAHKKILILSDWFYPAFKAGGPIQSLSNLIVCLEKEYKFFVVTSAYDLNSVEILDGINVNQWNEIQLPGSNQIVKAWYGGAGKPGLNKWSQLIKEIDPDTVYLSGIFTPRFILLPLLVLRSWAKKAKIIICPRGMLQQGALSGKSFKKNIYLRLLRISGLTKYVSWHATDETEKMDICRVFPGAKNIAVASNIPKKPVKVPVVVSKLPGDLRLIYLSLITEKKNLLLALQYLEQVNLPVIFDIYGPVKDAGYWHQCLNFIATMPAHIKVNYCGTVLPPKVQTVFSAYHALFLPTKGENFGHAIYECLSAARPVLISDRTPWRNLVEKKAGFDLPFEDSKKFTEALQALYHADQETYNEWCDGAHGVARGYWGKHDFVTIYKALFE